MIPAVISLRGRQQAALKQYVSPIGIGAMIICLAIGVAITVYSNNPVPALITILVGAYLAFSIKVADQWQKAAVLRMGRYIGLRGPGLFMIVPVIDSISQYVDQRVRVTDVKAESALTRDTVPVNVDAIVFWLVWNAEKSILEVQNFTEAITLSAQTGLRESIGRHEWPRMNTARQSRNQNEGALHS
jgi:regulator of protease activity HflC (stomatin/prohibitin superfamily)